MKRTLLIGLLALTYSFAAKSQTVIMWTDTFINGQATSAASKTAWNNFRAQLVPTNTYCSMTIKGTFDTVGVTCTDPAVVAAYANALNTLASYTSPTCGGNVWSLCGTRYNGEVWLNPPSQCSGANCPNPGYLIRPGITNSNWGGVNTQTCGAPNQRQWFIFRVGNPVANAPADTVLCAGASLTLSGTGNCTNYTWSNGVTDGVPFNVDSTRWYFLTGVDSAQCYAYDSMMVTVNPLPAVAVASSVDTVCVQSGPIVITGTPTGGTYSGTAVTTGQFAPNTAGTGDHWVMYTYTDTNGCSNTDSASIHVAPCVGIEEVSTYSWTVKPNPFNDQIQITSSSYGIDGNEVFVVRNTLGAIIREDILRNTTNRVDLSDLSPGVYIYQVRSSSGKVRDIGKLIKQ